MTGAGLAGRGGPVSSRPLPRPAARHVCPGPTWSREEQRDHPCAGVTMSTVPTTAAPDGRQAAISDAARRLYDAEVALHIARQTGVAAWISAACDRLHEAITDHTAALGSAGTAAPRSSGRSQPSRKFGQLTQPGPRRPSVAPAWQPATWPGVGRSSKSGCALSHARAAGIVD